ncbi:MAG: hypothetical protein ACFFBP_18680 [Promethearchaeota archaeon]
MSSDEFTVKILIRCPVCNHKGQLEVEKNLVKTSTRGIAAINVAEKVICEHSFIAYIDKNLDVRDSFVCDFKIDIPQIEISEEKLYETPQNFDLSIIKINLMPTLLASVIRAVLIAKKIALISEHEFLNEHYLRFLEYVFGDVFNFDITFLTRQEFKKNRKDYKNHIVWDQGKLIKDDEKIIEQSKLKIELAFVQQFYKEYDEISSLIMFKNEIYKIERIIHEILRFHKKQNKDEEFDTKQVIEHLNNIYHTNIPLPYLNFLLEIIENYYAINLNRPSKMADFFGLI